MKPGNHSRRKFLGKISAGAAGGILINAASPLFSNAQTNSLLADEETNNEYLFTEGLIYLNTGTLGPCRRETIEETKKVWEKLESLPLKYYGKWGAESLAEKTRTIAAKFLGCDMNEMLITNSTTNGMNAIAQGLRLKAGDHILTTDQEHGGGALCWNYFAKYYGIVIDTITILPGENNADAILTNIKKNIKNETRLISVSHIFSSTGLRVPIAEISSLARSKNILCIVDGAQAAGAIKVNVKELGCHAYATSGHKWLMGPKGTGLLYLSKEAQDIIRPMQFEESYNTYNDGNGVVNSAGILGLGKAIEYLESVGITKVEEHNLRLRNRLYEKLSHINNLKIVSPVAGSPLASPMLACIIPETIERASFVKMLLDKHKLSIRPTHKQWFNGIRFSCHIFNTEKEIDFAADVLDKELGK
ncbi:MAG TPA: aminotransferase class V-fold PLP-dependent enzyme [Chitinophagaceae bacterium]|nr:aminotransferase class V-fold PLP-dependent enzyme [Chitinophagaceae bacterium]